jgi:hypothetical protein
LHHESVTAIQANPFVGRENAIADLEVAVLEAIAKPEGLFGPMEAVSATHLGIQLRARRLGSLHAG